MRKALFLLFLGISGVMFSQTEDEQEKPVVQFSGVVVTGDSLVPVPMATVYRARDYRGTTTDFVGFFTLPAYAGDTIVFSSIGYQTIQFEIPDTLMDNRYNLVQIMRKDTINLPVTYVYPYPHPSKFKQEFLAMDMSEETMITARRNLESVMMYDRMIEIPADGSENYRLAMQQRADQLYYQGQANPLSIFNPFNWVKFVQAWQNGDFKRR